MITRFGAIVLALCVMASPLAQAQQSTEAPPVSRSPSTQSPQIPSGNKAEATENKNPATSVMPILKPSEPPKDQNSGGHGAKSGDRVGAEESAHVNNETVIANFTIALAIATALLAVATFGLALSTRGLHQETRRLADEAVKQGEKTERQIAIAEQSTAASVAAAQAAIDAIGLERAWISIETPEWVGHDPELSPNGVVLPQGMGVHVMWRNTGRSPALDAQIHAQHAIINAADPIPNFEPIERDINQSAVVGPNLTMRSSSVVVGGEDLAGVLSGAKRIVLYNQITYKILGDDATVHRSEACVCFSRNGEFLDNNKMMVPRFEMGVVGPQNAAN